MKNGGASTGKTVVHMTSVHPPFDTRIFHKECKTLVAAGFDVSLIAAHDRTEVVDGVEIVGVKRSAGRGRRILVTPWRVFWQALKKRADVYHMHDPELLPVGMVLRAMRRTVVFDAHEHVSLSMRSKPWIPIPLRNAVALLMRASELLIGRVYNAVVVATPSIAEAFPDGSVTVVQNFPEREAFDPEGVTPYRDRDPVVLYLGVMAKLRGTRELVQAMEYLPPDARLCLAGRMAPDMEEDLSTLPGWAQTDFRGWVDRVEIANLASQARVGVVPFHPAPNHVRAQPNKLFEYLAAGLPVVTSDFPMWRALVEDIGCGLVADPLDPAALGVAIRWVLEHPDEAEAMGRRGAEAVAGPYSWEPEGVKLVDLYRTLMGC